MHTFVFAFLQQVQAFDVIAVGTLRLLLEGLLIDPTMMALLNGSRCGPSHAVRLDGSVRIRCIRGCQDGASITTTVATCTDSTHETMFEDVRMRAGFLMSMWKLVFQWSGR